MKRQYKIEKAKLAPEIDGYIKEDVWQESKALTELTQITPNPGNACSQKTKVWMTYDDEAVYIAAKLYEENPDSIYNFFTERDWFGNADFFIVVFNNYQDGINGEGFAVTPAGVQIDIKYSVIGESTNWDAVWESATQIDDEGWTVEMKIPFSALRFPETESQEWGMNFGREIRRKRERSWWNFINPRIDGFLTQTGVVSGIENIEPPTRLFFFPYTSTYAEYNSGQGSANDDYYFNVGMDIKYGLTDAFTLDMTVIPDFGQTRFDNQVLNLTPFEVQFNEYRQFFTEGVELFNKADLFYSRRIGGIPIRRNEVANNVDSLERIIENPRQGRLLNASKISGRNNKGLGIGVFNAIEDKTLARIQNTEDKTERSVVTNPLTNYNVIVFDQIIRNNSFVTLTNTNVLRQGSEYDANVSRLDLKLTDKQNKYAVSGFAAMSHKFETDKTISGQSWNLNLAKISGNWQWELDQNVIGNDYDINDLGFQLFRNISQTSASLKYRKFSPFGKFNRMRQDLNVIYERLYEQGDFFNFGLSYNSVYTLRNFFTFGLNMGLEPVETFDYFETRTFERYYLFPTNYALGGFISSDYSKPFALDARFNYRRFDEPGRYNLTFNVEPRFRPNDKLFFTPGYNYGKRFNEMGYIGTFEDTITFGRREVQVHETYINGSYIFNNKMALSLNLRHYWSVAKYDRFNNVDIDGELGPSNFDAFLSDGTTSRDVSFNAFNIDLIFRWRFAPGSDISIAWKNSILESGTPLEDNYLRGLENTLNAPQRNNFSIRLLYFIDYRNLKKS